MCLDTHIANRYWYYFSRTAHFKSFNRVFNDTNVLVVTMCQRSISLVYRVHAKVRRNSGTHSATFTLRLRRFVYLRFCLFVCCQLAYQHAVKTWSVFCGSFWQTLGNLFVLRVELWFIRKRTLSRHVLNKDLTNGALKIILQCAIQNGFQCFCFRVIRELTHYTFCFCGIEV